MYCDPERGAVGGHDGGDNVTYGEGGRGWVISETKNGILESQWFCVFNLTHFAEALHNLFRTMADGNLSESSEKIFCYDDLLAKHALYVQSNGTSPQGSVWSI